MISAKQADRLELLKDANYFAGELVTRLERLHRIEPHELTSSHWQQAAGLTRKVRGLLRHQADQQRERANKRKAVA